MKLESGIDVVNGLNCLGLEVAIEKDPVLMYTPKFF